MKRRLAVTLAFLCILALLSGCADVTLPANTTAPQDRDDPKPRTTAAPETEPETEPKTEPEQSESTSYTSGYSTPEEAAINFITAFYETDVIHLEKCVHPNMYPDKKSDFESYNNSQKTVKNINVSYVKNFDTGLSTYLALEMDYDIEISEVQDFRYVVDYYDYKYEEERRDSNYCEVILIDGQWYGKSMHY